MCCAPTLLLCGLCARRSVLENHHAATTFAVLDDAACDVLGTLTLSQRKEVRRLMIAAVLATDMAQHQVRGCVRQVTVSANRRAAGAALTSQLVTRPHAASHSDKAGCSALDS